MRFPFIFILLLSITALAQKAEQKKGVRLIARSMPDSVLLRWAPSDPHAWALGNQYGYMLERHTLIENKLAKDPPIKMQLSPQSIKPYPLASWESLAKKSDYGTIAAQAIYGESFELSDSKRKAQTSQSKQVYEKSTEQEMRFSFALLSADMDREVAKFSGLKWTDKNVKRGSKYLYKVYVALPGNTALGLDTGFVFTGPDEYLPLPKPAEFLATFSDTTVVLTWNQKLFASSYVAYYIERSTDGGSTFQKRNKEPFIAINDQQNSPYALYVDTVHTRKELIYRIRGLSSFGENGPFSITQKGVCKPLVRLAPESLKAVVDDKAVQLSWQYDAKNLSNITGFKVYRSTDIDNGYKAVSSRLLTSVRSFKDFKPLPASYYKVCAVDSKGNEKESFPILVQLEDTVPPKMPKKVVGSITKQGQITLAWEANKEGDLLGYYVYKANARKQEPSKVTGKHIKSSSFSETISLKSLTDSIFYQVTAIDGHHNESQPFVLALRKPDVIPPAPVLIRSTLATPKGIHLSWTNSNSKDAKQYEVIRKKGENSASELLAIVPHKGDSSVFLDSNVVPNQQYRYYIMAIDANGLKSEPIASLHVKALKVTLSTSFVQLQALRDTVKNQIQLFWQANGSPVKHWVIYRGTQGERLSQYEASESMLFTDTEVQKRKSYYYHVRPVYQNGELGPLSQKVEEQKMN